MIHEANFKVKKNAGSVQSDLGGGDNNSLVLFMRPDMYLILIGSEFNLPQQPGYLSVIPDGFTVATTSKLLQYHKVHKTQFYRTKSCDYYLK